MSASKPKKSESRPIIHQCPEVRETLASELIGAALLEGNIMLTFAVSRIFEGVGAHDAPRYKTVVCRLALTEDAFGQLCAAIPRLEGAIAMANQQPVPGQQPN